MVPRESRCALSRLGGENLGIRADQRAGETPRWFHAGQRNRAVVEFVQRQRRQPVGPGDDDQFGLGCERFVGREYPVGSGAPAINASRSVVDQTLEEVRFAEDRVVGVRRTQACV